MVVINRVEHLNPAANARGSLFRNIGAMLVILVVELAWLALLVFLAGALIFG